MEDERIMRMKKPGTKNSAFAGKSILVAGKLRGYTRDGINRKILSIGAWPAFSARRKADYVIAGERAGSRLTRAWELGATILTEREFEEMSA